MSTAFHFLSRFFGPDFLVYSAVFLFTLMRKRYFEGRKTPMNQKRYPGQPTLLQNSRHADACPFHHPWRLGSSHSHLSARALRTALQNTYCRAADSAADNLANLSDDLVKGMYTGSSPRLFADCARLWKESALPNPPIPPLPLESTLSATNTNFYPRRATMPCTFPARLPTARRSPRRSAAACPA